MRWYSDINAKVLEESGDYQAALDFLQTYNSDIRDRVAFMERMADLSLKLGRKEESLSWWKQLLLRNPDELRYHHRAVAALGLPPLNSKLTPEQLETLNQFWQPIREAHPRSATFDGLQLSCLSGAEFEALFEKRLCNQLRKGIPSLFGGMRHLYSEPEKVAAIESIILKAEKSLRELQVLPDRAPDSEKEPPTTLLWLLCYLALHFNERGQFERALDYLREGHDDHTPTMHELYMIKANVLKHTGALAEASAQLEYVRKLDTADRFLNTKSVKYLLAANQPEEATAVVQLFTKDNDDFDPVEKGQTYLDYMQAMWWESRLAACYERLGRHDEALAMHRIILGHFKGIIEDQFDFHSYVLRKMTIRAYTQLLRFADGIYTHKQYRLAARGAIRVALKLEKKRASEPPKGLSSINTREPVQVDPKQAKPPATLETFVNDMKNLLQFSPDEIQNHILAAKYYQARNKPLLVIRALKNAYRLDKASPALHVRLVRFLAYLDQQKEMNPAVREVVTAELKELVSSPVKDFAAAWAAEHKSSQAHRLAAARVARSLGQPAAAVLPQLQDLGNARLTCTAKAKKAIAKNGSEADVLAFVEAARPLFPRADFLAPLRPPTENSEASDATVELMEQ